MKIKQKRNGTFKLEGLTLEQVRYIEEALVNILTDEYTEPYCVWLEMFDFLHDKPKFDMFTLKREDNGNLVMRLRKPKEEEELL